MSRGSAPGERRGGRKKGTPNKATTLLSNAVMRAASENPGLEPLDYLLAVLRDEGADRRERFEAAKVAAPFRHARLANVNHTGQVGIHVTISGDDVAL